MRAAKNAAPLKATKDAVAQVAAASILKGKAVDMGESSRQQPKRKVKAVAFKKSEFPQIMYKERGGMIAKPHEQQPKKKR